MIGGAISAQARQASEEMKDNINAWKVKSIVLATAASVAIEI